MKVRLSYILCVAALALLLGACNKNASDEVPATTSAYLDVVNASDVVFNIYLNGTRLTNSANIYTLGHSGYLTVPGGSQNFSVKQPLEINSPALANPDTLFSKTLRLDSAQHYSLIVTNHTAAGAFIVPDTLDGIAGKAAIRFINASAAFSGLSIAINDTIRATGINYKSVSSYKGVAVPTGVNSTTLSSVVKVYQAGSTTPIATSTISTNIGSVYTLVTQDAKTATGAATVGIGLLLNQ